MVILSKFGSSLANYSLKKSIILKQLIRNSHGRTIEPTSGKFYTKLLLNLMHLHVSLVAIPCGLWVFYANVIQGPAKLVDIPEGYEPRSWEYYSHPIRRFLARYFYSTPEQIYEASLHDVYINYCERRMRDLEKKVDMLKRERQDYQGWYYVPVSDKPHEYKKRTVEETRHGGYREYFGGK